MFSTGILRTLIIAAFLLLVVKTLDMAARKQPVREILVAESVAKSEAPAKEEAPKETEHKKEESHSEEKKEEGKAEKSESHSSGGHGEEAKTEAPVQEKVISVDEVKTYTDAEIEVLERLSERREKLLKWEKDLQVKESVLKITEEKIDKKMEALRILKKDVEKSLAEYRKEEDAKTQSLIKIYENMKPKNAADILSKMSVPDILPIMGRMKEKNAALILAKMDPKVAKDVTTRLNNIGKINSSNMPR